MEIKLSMGEEEIGMNNSMEIKKDEGGASKEMLEEKMDSLKEEKIWWSPWHRSIDAAQTYAAARRLEDVITGVVAKKFSSEAEALGHNLSAIVNFLGLPRGSLLHIAAGDDKDDIPSFLLDYAQDYLIAAQDDWGNTPLHIATKAGNYSAANILIGWARNRINVESILRIENKQGNTALHEAVLNGHANVVRYLLSEDSEPMYRKNVEQKSPLYLALNAGDSVIDEFLWPKVKPWLIQGLPPVHGAIMRQQYDLLSKILKWNKMLFAMTDSRGGNVFHLAAFNNQPQVFELLLSQTEYLARERDMNGDLPIHIASKMGNVKLIEKLYPVSLLLNGRGQTVLHVAAKYGKASAVRYILRHPELGMLINERDQAGNTALHLAAMHSQPTALIPLLDDERTDFISLNHECMTAFEISLHRGRTEPTYRKFLAFLVLASAPTVSKELIILRPEARDTAFPKYGVNEKMPKIYHVKDVINTRLLVATLVTTVTFAAGFAVPGGFNGLDTASKYDRGMATMLDNGMFQVFTICNTIAMFCSMTAVVNLMLAQQSDIHKAVIAYQRSKLPLTIALPAMSAAFLTGVTLTVGKLPWLANTVFYLGLIFLLVISVANLIESPSIFPSRLRRIHLLICWLVRAHIYLWGIETYLLDDPESASQPPDGAGVSKTDD